MIEETPKVDFSITDESGEVVFRDSIVFTSMAELRNTSQAEREAIMQERYQNFLAAINQQGE